MAQQHKFLIKMAISQYNTKVTLDEFVKEGMGKKGAIVIDAEEPGVGYYASPKIANSIKKYGNSHLGKAVASQQKQLCNTERDISGVEMAAHFEGTISSWTHKYVKNVMKQDDKKDATVERLRAKLAAKKAK